MKTKFERVSLLPPYVFAEINDLKAKERLKGRCACEYGYNFSSKDGQCVELKVRVKRDSGTKKEQKGFTVETVAIMILNLMV